MAIKVQVLVTKDGVFDRFLFTHLKMSTFTVEECLKLYPTVGTVTTVGSDVITVEGGPYSVAFVKQAFVK